MSLYCFAYRSGQATSAASEGSNRSTRSRYLRVASVISSSVAPESSEGTPCYCILCELCCYNWGVLHVPRQEQGVDVYRSVASQANELEVCHACDMAEDELGGVVVAEIEVAIPQIKGTQ